MHQLVRQFARSAGAGAAGSSDPDLLRRFIDAADQDAFAELVRRHGPMVLDVCRCVLGNHADAEDAFQATFLALAKRAGSIRKAASLAAWLHGVAYRTARRAQVRAARRREREARVPAREPAGPDDLSWAEVRLAVHEALAALAESYRAPLVLCYLVGMTQDRAAAALGLSDAALKKRLERGREKLRAALTRRGLGPTALLAALAVPAVAGAVPPAVADSVVRLAAPFAAGSLSVGAVPLAVLKLVNAEVAPMALSSLTAVLAVPVLVVGAVLAGASPQPGETRARNSAPTATVRADDKKQTPAEQEAKWLAGEWKVAFVEAGGKTALPDDLRDARITFKDGKAEVKGFELLFVKNFSFKIDPTAKPKEIDVTFLEGAMKGETFEGCYVTLENEVRVCLRLENTKFGRPKGFRTSAGSGLYTFFLRPVDEKAPPPKLAPGLLPAAAPKFDAVLRDGERLYFVLTPPAGEKLTDTLATLGGHLDLALKVAEGVKNPDATIVFFLRSAPDNWAGGYSGFTREQVRTIAALPADKRAAKLLEHAWKLGQLPDTAAPLAPAADDPRAETLGAELRKKWDAIPVPEKTPFDADPKKRADYLRSYRHGHFWAQGEHLFCPTNPSKDNLHAIRGWVEGWQAGVKAGGVGDLPAKYAPYLVWRGDGKQ